MRLIESKYSSEITHARIRCSPNSVSLSEELKFRETGDPLTRKSKAGTRTMNTILKSAKNFSQYELEDTCLLQYLRMVVQNVEFAKTVQFISFADKNTTFEKLKLSILIATKLEDSFNPKTRRSEIYFAKKDSDDDSDSDENSEDLLDQ